MRRIALVSGLFLLTSCGGDGTRTYERNDLQLLSGYTAKEACSCLFVMEQTEAFCRNWVRASPAVASWSFDEDEKSVRAGAILFWGAKARWVSEKFGCALE